MSSFLEIHHLFKYMAVSSSSDITPAELPEGENEWSGQLSFKLLMEEASISSHVSNHLNLSVNPPPLPVRSHCVHLPPPGVSHPPPPVPVHLPPPRASHPSLPIQDPTQVGTQYVQSICSCCKWGTAESTAAVKQSLRKVFGILKRYLVR